MIEVRGGKCPARAAAVEPDLEGGTSQERRWAGLGVWGAAGASELVSCLPFSSHILKPRPPL